MEYSSVGEKQSGSPAVGQYEIQVLARLRNLPLLCATYYDRSLADFLADFFFNQLVFVRCISLPERACGLPLEVLMKYAERDYN